MMARVRTSGGVGLHVAGPLKWALVAAIAVGGASFFTTVRAGPPPSILDPQDVKVARHEGCLDALGSSSEVRVEQFDVQIVVHAQSTVNTDPATIWSTLSDYDNLAGFIPGMTYSRTVSRSGTEAIVEQKGIVNVGPLQRRFTVLMLVDERAGESLIMSTAGGDFTYFQGRYDILPLTASRSCIVYEATFVPAQRLPASLSVPVIQRMVNNQFGTLVREVSRRAES